MCLCPHCHTPRDKIPFNVSVPCTPPLFTHLSSTSTHHLVSRLLVYRGTVYLPSTPLSHPLRTTEDPTQGLCTCSEHSATELDPRLPLSPSTVSLSGILSHSLLSLPSPSFSPLYLSSSLSPFLPPLPFPIPNLVSNLLHSRENLELVIILPAPPECWDHKCMPL